MMHAWALTIPIEEVSFSPEAALKIQDGTLLRKLMESSAWIVAP